VQLASAPFFVLADANRQRKAHKKPKAVTLLTSGSTLLANWPERRPEMPILTQNEINDPNRLWTLPELAEVLRLDVCTVLRWARVGRIRSVKLNRAYRIPADEVLRLRTEGTAPRPEEG